MRKDASERLTIEQMLQHPWLLHEGRTSGAEGGGGGTLQQRGRSMMLSMIGTRTQRDAGGASTEGLSEQVLAFRRLTAQLRATCFAVMLRQQAAEREAKARGVTRQHTSSFLGGGKAAARRCAAPARCEARC